MKKPVMIVLVFLVFVCLVGTAAASGGEENLPAQVPRGHWSCKETAELSAKYGSLKKLPDGEMVESKELAAAFLALMEKVQEKCEKEGADAVSREDLDRLAALYEALKHDLPEFEGYLSRRESIVKMLAKPEEPLFEYKLGVAGFLRGEGAGNFTLPDFTYESGHAEGRFLYRVKPYVYWHPADWLDIGVEGQGYGYDGGDQHLAKFSLYQGFVEAKWPTSNVVAVKGGRQEITYGSAFILGNDPFIKGRSYDALRLRVQPVEGGVVDLFAGNYATPFSLGQEGTLSGAYGTYALKEGIAVELYAIRDTISTDHHMGEHEWTFGARGTAKLGPVSLEIEPVVQTREVFNPATNGNDTIGSYGGHVDADIDTTMGEFHNHLFLSYAYGSGSQGAANGGSTKGEFHTPLNDSSLMGDMKVLGDLSGFTLGDHHASGLQIYTLGWGVDITKGLNFSATGRYAVANDVESGFSRTIGLETDFTLTYFVNDNLSFIAGYDRFFTGGFFRDATGSGKDIDYGYFMVQFDISHVKPKVRKVGV